MECGQRFHFGRKVGYPIGIVSKKSIAMPKRLPIRRDREFLQGTEPLRVRSQFSIFDYISQDT